MITCLLQQDPERQAAEFFQENLNFRFFYKLWTGSDSEDNDISQTFVFFHRCRKRVLRSNWESICIPKGAAPNFEFPFRQFLQAHDVVLIGKFIHLRVNQKTLS